MRGISLVMHLDAVHQNVVRYKLLMERYRKLIPDTLVEADIAERKSCCFLTNPNFRGAEKVDRRVEHREWFPCRC